MHEAHDAYLCVGEKTYVNVTDRRRYSEEHYLKSSEEMYKIFHDLPDALENNEKFPVRVSYRPINSSPVLPDIQKNKIKNVNELLEKESLEGLKEKLSEYVFPHTKNENLEKVSRIYNERLSHEINIISKMKYASYFSYCF